MVNLFQKPKPIESEIETTEIQPQHILVAGAGLEVLREIRDKINQIQFKLTELEKRLEDKIPEKVLTENKFKEEIDTSEDIVERIISEVKALVTQKTIQKAVENNLEVKPTMVELRRIEKITGLLQKHEKLTSFQLAQLLNLSRTRANEYLKQMENFGIVEPVLIGKEKYYQLTTYLNSK